MYNGVSPFYCIISEVEEPIRIQRVDAHPDIPSGAGDLIFRLI